MAEIRVISRPKSCSSSSAHCPRTQENFETVRAWTLDMPACRPQGAHKAGTRATWGKLPNCRKRIGGSLPWHELESIRDWVSDGTKKITARLRTSRWSPFSLGGPDTVWTTKVSRVGAAH